MTLQLSKDGGRPRGYSVGPVAVGAFPSNRVGFTIETPSDADGDGNRVTDTITLEAYLARPGTTIWKAPWTSPCWIST